MVAWFSNYIFKSIFYLFDVNKSVDQFMGFYCLPGLGLYDHGLCILLSLYWIRIFMEINNHVIFCTGVLAFEKGRWSHKTDNGKLSSPDLQQIMGLSWWCGHARRQRNGHARWRRCYKYSITKKDGKRWIELIFSIF